MVKFILRAKHWQIFIVVIGIPFLIQSFYSMSFMNSLQAQIDLIDAGNPPNEEILISQVLSFFNQLPILTAIYMLIQMVWMWAMGIGLQEKIPGHIDMKVGRFKFFFFLQIIYWPLFVIGMSYLVSYFSDNLDSFISGESVFDPSNFQWLFYIIPIHLLALFSMLYLMYFMAKTYKTAELQRETTLSDFIGEFFLYWLYFVGVWIMQPKINEMIDNEELPSSEETESVFTRDY